MQLSPSRPRELLVAVRRVRMQISERRIVPRIDDPSHSAFVGASRRRILDELTEAFTEVRCGASSRGVVLASPAGWGKTRIVQELYARLAADQQAPAYWPPAIVNVSDGATLNALSRARKAVFP